MQLNCSMVFEQGIWKVVEAPGNPHWTFIHGSGFQIDVFAGGCLEEMKRERDNGGHTIARSSLRSMK